MFGRKKKHLQQAMNAVPFWWHSIELGRGVVTPGVKPLENLGAELAALQFPDLSGKSLLDIGAWDGFFSFAAERRKAARVVALDHYVWSLDLAAHQRYWQECRAQGQVPEPYPTVPGLWHPETLPGKQGFDTARQALASRVDSVVGDFMEIDLQALGTFDVVLYKGVLYHMENPLDAVRRVAQVTGELAIIETAAVAIPGFEERALWEFYPSDELNFDPSNWWAPNLEALRGLCRAVGFREVKTVLSPLPAAELAAGEVHRYRAIVHAYK